MRRNWRDAAREVEPDYVIEGFSEIMGIIRNTAPEGASPPFRKNIGE